VRWHRRQSRRTGICQCSVFDESTPESTS
jgi:hypothetical protein